MKTITLALTGASGIPYGMRLLECLLQSGARVQLVYSQAAQIVAKQEMDFVLANRAQDAEKMLTEKLGTFSGELKVYGIQDWYAPMASGSNPGDAMVICPCTMGTLGKVAGGISDDLIARAADVMLKEKRTLILVPREMPFSAIHLENMLKLSHAGAVIMPPNPGFYHHPQSVQDMVDFVVARILDHLGVEQTLIKPWGEA
ncbi:MAG: aromatic acid decarboxylase [Gallionellales bacterium 35-53-114]|jgi:4-hydroxy-3-polyprenylbenzoate decarboxylase|nr:MAG: aromatic acid decarboxylase [Gallionellales bacterium 35-53-114]OYZ63785.1 MAG: aromatic acid decarboxylase [Gallionellales bacterium 24-53-125]OZB09383.1 MAG: aromatic acid decarboxylase [Gallionellales bacterium 39-52-133]HQS57961.1 flavin prenyltransferase UbiX [Gallionellaceae bacterium]HQS76122.1 flavin prenyltransferase UbiX [Gallionellaceae bacterium]